MPADTMIVSLPMYDLPELRARTRDWADGLLRHLEPEFGKGIIVAWDEPVVELWRSDQLLLSQSCGYPVTHDFADVLQPLATPIYSVPGCHGARYSSAIITKDNRLERSLPDFAGQRLALNGFDSQSGWAALRADVIAGNLPLPFFDSVVVTGSHRESIAKVHHEEADLAAIDAVTLALLANHAANELAGIQVLGWTRTAPSLPYVTAMNAGPERVESLRRVLLSAMGDPDLAPARSALHLQGFVLSKVADYREILDQPYLPAADIIASLRT